MSLLSVKLAWRNLWRNPRRTWLTVLPISLTIFLAVFLHAQQAGLENQILETLILPNFGHLQIQAKNTVTQDTLAVYLAHNQAVKSFTPRLENYGQIRFKTQIRNVALLGISPTSEANFSQLNEKITQGKYLDTPEKNQILISEGLANQLKINILDTIYIYHSISEKSTQSVCKVIVRGFIKLKSTEADENTVFIPITLMNLLFPSLSSTYLIQTKHSIPLENLASEMKKKLGTHYTIKTWPETAPDLAQMIQADQTAGWFLASIFYLLCGFNIFGTILMIVNERRQELAILKAIGMNTWKILQMLYNEIVMICVLGIFIGLLFVLPLVGYLEASPLPLSGVWGQSLQNMGFEPTLTFRLQASAIYLPTALMLFIMCLSAWYPRQIVRNLVINETLKNKVF